MKPVLIVLGIVVVLCCAGGLISFFWIKGNVDSILAGATTFGNESTSAIATNWDPGALRDRADPSMTDTDIQSFCKTAREGLGKTTSFTGKADMKVESKTSSDTGTYTQVPYRADLTCEKGKALLRLELIKRGETWKILSIDVQPN
ncbi:MAG TPA: hypothetical protein PLL78_04225 [Fimbriimonadaceae bacterium]|nr:hypothetical protein [Fimbriimonadaceae bacterium]HRJ95869.1 hypothetical protein [Fimbriimonadaceae bacterium]